VGILGVGRLAPGICAVGKKLQHARHIKQPGFWQLTISFARRTATLATAAIDVLGAGHSAVCDWGCAEQFTAATNPYSLVHIRPPRRALDAFQDRPEHTGGFVSRVF
jgi:hypothetical protein